MLDLDENIRVSNFDNLSEDTTGVDKLHDRVLNILIVLQDSKKKAIKRKNKIIVDKISKVLLNLEELLLEKINERTESSLKDLQCINDFFVINETTIKNIGDTSRCLEGFSQACNKSMKNI